MQTKHLVSFLTAAKEKSLYKASVILNYAPSTIYGHISALEKELGVELYIHTSKAPVLTDEGKLLTDYADRILSEWDRCKAEVGGKNQDQVRICASETLGRYYLCSLLSKFMKTRPRAKIDFKSVPGTIAVERVRSRECDIAFCLGVTPPFEGITATKLFSAKMFFAAHPAHSFARCKNVPKTIQREVLVGNLDIDYVQKIIQEAGIDFDQFFSSYVRVGGVDLVKSFPLNNEGVALLPEITLNEDVEQGRLDKVRWFDRAVKQDAYMLTPKKRFVSPYIEELAAMAVEQYKE